MLLCWFFSDTIWIKPMVVIEYPSSGSSMNVKEKRRYEWVRWDNGKLEKWILRWVFRNTFCIKAMDVIQSPFDTFPGSSMNVLGCYECRNKGKDKWQQIGGMNALLAFLRYFLYLGNEWPSMNVTGFPSNNEEGKHLRDMMHPCENICKLGLESYIFQLISIFFRKIYIVSHIFVFLLKI